MPRKSNIEDSLSYAYKLISVIDVTTLNKLNRSDIVEDFDRDEILENIEFVYKSIDRFMSPRQERWLEDFEFSKRCSKSLEDNFIEKVHDLTDDSMLGIGRASLVELIHCLANLIEKKDIRLIGDDNAS